MSDLPVPPWRTPRKSRAPRQPLSQDAIVDAALAVLDREGIEGVSMRRIAQELDTGPASLYAHVSNKEELLELLLDRISAQVPLPEPDPERWQEQLKEIARGVYRGFQRHTDIALVALANVPTGPNAALVSERLFAVLRAGGVPARPAGWFVDRLFLYLAADAYEGALHRVRQRASGKDVGAYMADFVRQIRDYYHNLPPDRFPYLSANADELTSGDGDERFEFGLELLVTGIAAHAFQKRSRGRVP